LTTKATKHSKIPALRLNFFVNFVPAKLPGSHAMDRCDDPHQEIEDDLVADLQPWRECLGPDPRDARLTVRFVGERVVHVVRQLTVNTDWLHPLQHALSGSLQHKSLLLTDEPDTGQLDSGHGCLTVQRRALDLVEHLHAGDHATEDGVLVVECR